MCIGVVYQIACVTSMGVARLPRALIPR